MQEESKPMLLVFTDLDGSLLDHHTYQYSQAQRAFTALIEFGSRLILSSSKTEAEMTPLHLELGLSGPFAVENGSVIVQPATKPAGPEKTFLGTSYAALREWLDWVRQQHGLAFRGFGDMTAQEVARATDLSFDQASRAKLRQASEPLEWQDDDRALAQFTGLASQHGFRVTRGGRFVHLMGNTDKGAALEWIKQSYQARHPTRRIHIAAIGDALNDVSMLRAAEHQVWLPGSCREALSSEEQHQAILPVEPGPTGWAAGVREVLARIL